MRVSALNKTMPLPSLRQVSWTVFAIGSMGPAVWCRVQLDEFDRIHPAPACGMPILGIVGMAVLMATASSLIAGGFGLFAYVRLARPRKRVRLLELALLSLPALVGLLLFLSIMIL